MATVELRFSASPEHVRTARLVAAAVARRAGVEESVLDELRLAVGEACSRAVGLHAVHGLTTPVRVVLTEGEKTFSIEVGDDAPSVVPAPRDQTASEAAEETDELGLAVISGLVDDVEVISDSHGGKIRMSWPTPTASVS
ncbi:MULTISPECIES: ATP-binding protein [Streptomyces]|uniref:ATP-binding protein n=1 Tax=Streptomyces radicis TaxID=1750517 RepID=A0A3A9WVJ8_9ACTN|nr:MULTISPECIES: ATP-binding protein [Streptomyces]RBM22539.1 anti-sigma regulatory factor [Streptomyces sp. PT12]RKN10147.1 ATP-binding protein [Streptomyces radicis]RKN24489.1 ATP-binding protein [Streptomyces radicis]